MDTDRNICLRHLFQICLQIDKLLHIRVGTVDRDHKSSSPAVLSDQCSHKRIKFHEGHRAARLFGRIVDLCAAGTQF